MRPREGPETSLRRPWQVRQWVTAYGARVVLRTNRAAVMPLLRSRLPLGSELSFQGDGGAPDHVYSIVFTGNGDQEAALLRDGRRVAFCRSQASLLDIFASQLALGVARAARERVFLHCGVVGWRGQAILIPGRTCYGKTTLVARFLEAGATYYSDEFALLDSAGHVHPYARPLQIRRQHGNLLQTPVSAEALGGAGGIGRDAIQPVLMLACRYRDRASWRPTQITPGAATLELLRHSLSAYWSPEAAFHAASLTASRLSAWRGWRGEAQPVVEWALRRLDAGR
jgi:hypothetical protein